MANDEFRDQQQESRKHGLAARQETRVERAIRRQVGEEIALWILDYRGPDPSPASPAWWAGYTEAQQDCARMAREIGAKENS